MNTGLGYWSMYRVRYVSGVMHVMMPRVGGVGNGESICGLEFLDVMLF